MSRATAFVSWVTTTRDRALLSWAWLNTCLPMGGWQRVWIPSFALHAHTAFTFLIALSSSWPMSFVTFAFPILSPIPLWWGESRCMGLNYQLGLTHTTPEKLFLSHPFTQALWIPKTEMLNSKFWGFYFVNMSKNMYVSGPKFVDIDAWLKSVSGPGLWGAEHLESWL